MHLDKREAGMVALAGISVAVVMWLMPVGLVEQGVASSGLSEAWPAAAPPLGSKARLLLCGFAALMTMGAIMMTRRERPLAAAGQNDGERDWRAEGARLMGFAFTKLSAFAKGRSMPPMESAPTVRRADAHPDAPVRTPIFASRDFGGADIFDTSDKPDAAPTPTMLTAPLAFEATELRSANVFSLPTLGVAEPADAVTEDDRIPAAPAAIAPAAPAMDPSPPAPTRGLSLSELTQRLERGLSLRSRTPAPAPAPSAARIIADMPVAPAVPVRDMPSENADEALRAALSALRNLTAQPR